MKTTPLAMLFLSAVCTLGASRPMTGSRGFGRGGSGGREGHTRRDLDELYVLKRDIAELSDRLNVAVAKRANIGIVTQDMQAKMKAEDSDGVVPNEEQVHWHTYMPLGVGKRGNIHVVTLDEEAAMAKADPDGVVPNEEQVHWHTYVPLGVGKREEGEVDSIDDSY